MQDGGDDAQRFPIKVAFLGRLRRFRIDGRHHLVPAMARVLGVAPDQLFVHDGRQALTLDAIARDQAVIRQSRAAGRIPRFFAEMRPIPQPDRLLDALDSLHRGIQAIQLDLNEIKRDLRHDRAPSSYDRGSGAQSGSGDDAHMSDDEMSEASAGSDRASTRSGRQRETAEASGDGRSHVLTGSEEGVDLLSSGDNLSDLDDDLIDQMAEILSQTSLSRGTTSDSDSFVVVEERWESPPRRQLKTIMGSDRSPPTLLSSRLYGYYSNMFTSSNT